MANVSANEFRPGLEFDVEALRRYLAQQLDGFELPPLVQQFPGGQSNPTYKLTTPLRRYALRRKPPGALLPSAHAIDREFRVLKALSEHSDVPVARPYLLCQDASIIGTDFYLMDFVDGRTFWDPSLPELPAAARRPIFAAMNDVLARLHCLSPQALGLADFGRADGYLVRQVARWSKQYQADEQAGRDANMDLLIAWLPQHLPAAEPAAAVVHGDYRIDNLIFDPSEPRVIAVMDWELATIGDPIADFAYNLMMYRMSNASIPGLLGRDPAALGIPSEAQYVQAYCRRRGLPGIDDLDFYLAFCMFRLAAIFHGIRGRVVRGTAVSPQARKYAAEVEGMAALAWVQAQRVSGV
jgi:aminoglycoside phosphotransferase (APT) family kinase protein